MGLKSQAEVGKEILSVLLGNLTHRFVLDRILTTKKLQDMFCNKHVQSAGQSQKDEVEALR